MAERRIGNGRNQVVLYAKGGERRIDLLPDASSLKYGRRLNQVSTAQVVIPTAGHSGCCGILGGIGSWGHELVIFRDGERVWEGPVTQPVWGKSQVTITAHDNMVKPSVTATREAVVVPDAAYVVDQGAADLVRSFTGDDPNVLTHLTVLAPGTGPTTTREVEAGDGYWGEHIADLVKAGLCWTVVGRRIVLWPSTVYPGRTASTLLPGLHMTAEVEIVEDGLALATGVLAVNDDGEAASSTGTNVDPFYGRVEAVVNSAAVGLTALTGVADQTRQRSYPAPLTLRVPAGSALSCDAPFHFSELVPGALVPVKVKGEMCRDVSATQQIEAVDVTVEANGETVALTLTQPSSGAVA